MNNTELMQFIFDCLEQVDVIEDYLYEKHDLRKGDTKDLTDPKFRKVVYEVNYPEEYLKDQLINLSNEQLNDLVSIMYFGRGDDDSLKEMKKYITKYNYNNKLLTKIMLEKRIKLKEYFQKGSQLAVEQGYDLNNF